MSTRRARIKAVATLPARRKNTADLNDTKANISSSAKKAEGEAQERKEHSNEVELTPVDQQGFTRTQTSTEIPPLLKVNNTESLALETAVETLKKPEQIIANQDKTTRSPALLFSPPFRKSSPVLKYAGSTKILPPSSPVQNEQNSKLSASDITIPPTVEKNNVKTCKPVNIEDLVFSPPSNSESIADEVIDGIVPLKPTQNAPKPIDLLKKPITSDNVEVLFDPIVPLPSPSKVRPKLRPAPRLPLRRNSVQGSASESEDESRRALLGGPTTPAPQRQRHDSYNIQTAPNKDVARVRSDSFSTSTSQNTSQPWQSVPASPLREKMSKARRNELSRRLSLIKRRKQMLRAVRDVKRQELTMYDLIFYNPLTNPIVPEKDDQIETVTGSIKEQTQEIVTETESVSVEEHGETPETLHNEPSTVEEDTSAPVPQIKLGPNGEIILDEQSLVIEQTESSRKLSESIVRENAWTNQGRGRYSRGKRTADWTDAETVRFYRALASVGTDFTLMEPLFPGRNRRDLKFKFKKEERLNSAQVDKALRSQTQWDGTRLENVFARERKDEVERAEKERQDYLNQRKAEKVKLKQTKREGCKISRASRAMMTCVEEGFKTGPNLFTADGIIKRSRKEKELTTNEIMSAIKLSQSPKPSLKTPFATLSVVNDPQTSRKRKDSVVSDLVTITPMSSQPTAVPSKIESGSLVVVTANDPNDPTKKVLQTYVSLNGKLTPVTLPSSLLTSVVGYMKKGSPSTLSSSSSPLLSPNSLGGQDNSRSSVIQINPTPSKRLRHDSFNITQL